MILSKKTNSKGADQTATMRRLFCAFVFFFANPEDRFSHVEVQVSSLIGTNVLTALITLKSESEFYFISTCDLLIAVENYRNIYFSIS